MSEQSWQDAAEPAFREAIETVEDITGVEGWTAKAEDDEIVQYTATVEFVFPVQE